MRITKKKLEAFLNSIANIKPSSIPEDEGTIYCSKIDGSYITHFGEEDQCKFLLQFGITEQIQNHLNESDHTSNIGFNPSEQKWYGWSHRGCCGFSIGSEVKKGDCAYNAPGKAGFIEQAIDFWYDKDYHLDVTGKESKNENGILGVQVSLKYNNKVPNKTLRNEIDGIFIPYPKAFGKGEWIAKTLQDAKKMACDYAENVS